MNAWPRIKSYLNSEIILADLLAITLGTLLIGFAPSSIILGLFVFFCFLRGVQNRFKIRLNFELFLPVCLYILFLASLLWSVDLEHTTKGLLRTITLLLIPLSFSLIPKLKEKFLIRILNVFTHINFLLGILFVLVSTAKFLNEYDVNSFFYHELVTLLNLNAVYVSLVFLISLFFLFSKKEKSRLNIIQIVFFCLFIFLLSSKTLIITLVTVIFLYFFKIGIKVIKKRHFLLIIGVLAVITIITSSSVIERISLERKTKFEEVFEKQTFGKAYNWTGTSIRLFQLRLLKEQLRDDKNLFLGYGLFASRNALKEKHLKYNTYPGYHNYNYHNQYAQFLSELGIVGLCYFLAMLFVTFKRAIRLKSFFIFIVFFVFSVSFFTEVFLWRQTGLFLFIILYSMLNSIDYKRSDNLTRELF